MGDSTSARDLGVYLHVPFCERVCPYCDFAVEAAGALDPGLARDYVGLLLRELELVREDEGDALVGRRLASVYLGGGTPSLLPAGEVERLLEGLVAAYGSLPEEVTLEANPGPLETPRLEGFRSAGVTRLSLGVQSLDDRTLKSLGRAQNGAQARRGLEAALACGFASFSADLIHFRPEVGNLTLAGVIDPAEADAIVDPDLYSKSVDYSFQAAVGEKLCRRLPAMAESGAERGYASLYAITPDWHPIVDELIPDSGFYVCTGFSGHGFKLGPAVGVMVADLLTGESQPEFAPDLFSLDRFAKQQLVQGGYKHSIVG